MNTRHFALAALVLASTGALAQASAPSLAPTPEGKLYTPGDFDRLEVDGAGKVRLVQADRDEVWVNGDETARAGVDIQRRGDRLSINLPGAWKFWSRDQAQVEVRMRSLSRITMSGAADLIAAQPVSSPQLAIEISGAGLVRFDDLKAGELSFSISGSGEGQLTGQAERLRLNVSGRGKMTATQFQTASANVSISGVGNADLWATDDLRVDISGAGHVHFRGKPRIRQTISGLGSVDPLDGR